MNKKNSKDFPCPNCNVTGTSTIKKRICVSKNPELREKILNGSFFEWECQSCKERFFIEDIFLYNDDANKFMVYFVPGFDKEELKIPTLLRTKDEYDTKNSKLRVTANFIDFVEKIRIFEAALDDRVIEMMKAVFSQAYKQNNDKVIYNMVFEEKNGVDDLSFAVFLENDDFAIDIPLAAYEQAKSDFFDFYEDSQEEVFLSIDQSWLVKVLRDHTS